MTATPDPHDSSLSAGQPAISPERDAVRVIAVVGPTAVGKSALAEELAVRLGGEIVSADSMQVYRRLDIGTAKPPSHQQRVAHHCLDLVEPGEEYSAALYQHDARQAIEQIAARGSVPIVAGGTGLYVRAALDDMRFPSGELNGAARERLEALADEIGSHGMHRRLQRADPAAAELIHPNNVRRTIRALEMAEEGVSYADQASRFSDRTSYYPTLYLGLTMSRSTLYERINARVEAMLEAGLLEEVRRLVADGFADALTASQAIGYKELIPVVEGRERLDVAVEDIKRATRRYAKRQLSWFRADPRISWVDADRLPAPGVVEAVEPLIQSFGYGAMDREDATERT